MSKIGNYNSEEMFCNIQFFDLTNRMMTLLCTNSQRLIYSFSMQEVP